MVDLRPVRDGDVAAIAGVMRAADRAECAAHGLDPMDALESCLIGATEAWTCVIDGVPAALVGVTVIGGVGGPWMLGTDRLLTAWVRVARLGRALVARWSATWPLENVCDTQNAVALRFLAWLGFTVDPTVSRFARFSLAVRS